LTDMAQIRIDRLRIVLWPLVSSGIGAQGREPLRPHAKDHLLERLHHRVHRSFSPSWCTENLIPVGAQQNYLPSERDDRPDVLLPSAIHLTL